MSKVFQQVFQRFKLDPERCRVFLRQVAHKKGLEVPLQRAALHPSCPFPVKSDTLCDVRPAFVVSYVVRTNTLIPHGWVQLEPFQPRDHSAPVSLTQTLPPAPPATRSSYTLHSQAPTAALTRDELTAAFRARVRALMHPELHPAVPTTPRQEMLDTACLLLFLKCYHRFKNQLDSFAVAEWESREQELGAVRLLHSPATLTHHLGAKLDTTKSRNQFWPVYTLAFEKALHLMASRKVSLYKGQACVYGPQLVELRRDVAKKNLTLQGLVQRLRVDQMAWHNEFDGKFGLVLFRRFMKDLTHAQVTGSLEGSPGGLPAPLQQSLPHHPKCWQRLTALPSPYLKLDFTQRRLVGQFYASLRVSVAEVRNHLRRHFAARYKTPAESRKEMTSFLSYYKAQLRRPTPKGPTCGALIHAGGFCPHADAVRDIEELAHANPVLLCEKSLPGQRVPDEARCKNKLKGWHPAVLVQMQV